MIKNKPKHKGVIMQVKEESFLSFTDLSRKLINDDKAEIYKQLLDEISKRLSSNNSALKKGLPSAEKNAAEAECAALEAGKRVIDLFWHATHSQQPTT